MADWTFRLPTRSDVPRNLVRNMRVVYSAADIQDLATVSVFCEEESHEGDPWLLGTFAPSEELLDQGRLHWYLHPDYPTGDGHMIRVNDTELRVSLVANSVVDTAILRGAAKVEALDNLRTRYSLACELCGLKRTAKSSTVQGTVTRLHVVRMREVSLAGMIGALKLFGDADA